MADPWEEAKEGALSRLLREKRRAEWRESLRDGRTRKAFIDAAIKWIIEKWPVPRECPYCANTEWEVGTPVELHTGEEVMSPHFPVMCSNCGNTVFINAIRAGLVPESYDAEP